MVETPICTSMPSKITQAKLPLASYLSNRELSNTYITNNFAKYNIGGTDIPNDNL